MSDTQTKDSFKINQPIREIRFDGLAIGGDKSFNFLNKNGNTTSPVFALELNIFDFSVSSHIVKDWYGEGTKSEVEIVKLAQNTDCDILALKFNLVDESDENIARAKALLKELLPQIKKPLLVRGANNKSVDTILLPALMDALREEGKERKAIIAFADENSYKQIVPKVIEGGHILVIRTPIDINLAKEMNVLAFDMGLSLDNILIDTDMGGLGYGLEYGYSIMERIKLAAFEGDSMLNMPLIAFAGEEALKAKEAKSEAMTKSWGDFKTRSKMFEITTAAAVIAAGANLVVLEHPDSIKTLKKLVG